MIQAPSKARSDVEILVERFNQWADERIFYLEDMPLEYLENWRIVQRARIETLQFSKTNIKRLAEEIVRKG